MYDIILQAQYEKIHSFFKTTTEPFDLLDWDGSFLNVWLKDKVIEKYTYDDLKKLIPEL